MDILAPYNSAVITKMSIKSAQDTSMIDVVPDVTLDITGETCPMTFVRTRLALDRLATGQILLVLLRGDEPRRNVGRTAASLGHAVLEQREQDGVTRLLLRRG
jgi:tRNA 2-thiouridine synthesizing protein A